MGSQSNTTADENIAVASHKMSDKEQKALKTHCKNAKLNLTLHVDNTVIILFPKKEKDQARKALLEFWKGTLPEGVKWHE